MVNPIAKEISKILSAGYRISESKGGNHFVLDPQGRIVRSTTGQKIIISGSDSPKNYRAIRHQLQAAGAIPRPNLNRKDKPEPRAKTHTSNFILLAQEALRDPSTRSRERKLAHECLRLVDVNMKFGSLNAELGRKLKRYEELER